MDFPWSAYTRTSSNFYSRSLCIIQTLESFATSTSH